LPELSFEADDRRRAGRRQAVRNIVL